MLHLDGIRNDVRGELFNVMIQSCGQLMHEGLMYIFEEYFPEVFFSTSILESYCTQGSSNKKIGTFESEKGRYWVLCDRVAVV